MRHALLWTNKASSIAKRFLERSLLANDLWNRYDLHDAKSKWHLLIDTSVFDISYDSAEIIRKNVLSFRLSRERYFSEFYQFRNIFRRKKMRRYLE